LVTFLRHGPGSRWKLIYLSFFDQPF